MADKPNPGSQAARDQGCLCPRMDNCNGKFAPFPPDGWYIREDCPIHAPSLADVSSAPDSEEEK